MSGGSADLLSSVKGCEERLRYGHSKIVLTVKDSTHRGKDADSTPLKKRPELLLGEPCRRPSQRKNDSTVGNHRADVVTGSYLLGKFACELGRPRVFCKCLNVDLLGEMEGVDPPFTARVCTGIQFLSPTICGLPDLRTLSVVGLKL